ncbi:MAG: hypothetical protein HY902_05950 [Deltaproteobacteria bacterium]|nr:hypothetical protein [Deltaproteobacteria bacterium]
MAKPLERTQQVPLLSAVDLAARYAHLALLPREVLVVVGLDRRGLLLCETLVRGQVGHVAVRPGEALRAVVASGAAALALVHNHPSGRGQPSAADVAFTGRMAAAARLLGLALLDHVVVASRGWCSMAERGLLLRPPR